MSYNPRFALCFLAELLEGLGVVERGVHNRIFLQLVALGKDGQPLLDRSADLGTFFARRRT